MIQYLSLVPHGEMAERFKALVLKTSDVERHRGFESLSLRQLCLSREVGENRISPAARGSASTEGTQRDRGKTGRRPADVPKWLKGLPC